MFLCNSSLVWLILMSISRSGMTSTGTKDFGWLYPFTARNLTSSVLKMRDLFVLDEVLWVWSENFNYDQYLGFSYSILEISDCSGSSLLAKQDWYSSGSEVKDGRWHVSILSWDYIRETAWSVNQGLKSRYYMWTQPCKLLLKRLTVYLSAILKTLFENKVFDTILSPLCYCLFIFFKMLSWFLTELIITMTLFGWIFSFTGWYFSSGFNSHMKPVWLCSWISSTCSSFSWQSKYILARWVDVVLCQDVLAWWPFHKYPAYHSMFLGMGLISGIDKYPEIQVC